MKIFRKLNHGLTQRLFVARPCFYQLTLYTLLFGFMLGLYACTTIKYKDGTAEFQRTSFGTQLQITELKATTDGSNNRTITMQGYTSDQTESLKAVAEGVAKGIASGIKP